MSFTSYPWTHLTKHSAVYAIALNSAATMFRRRMSDVDLFDLMPIFQWPFWNLTRFIFTITLTLIGHIEKLGLLGREYG